jgi:O-methyltransferase domain
VHLSFAPDSLTERLGLLFGQVPLPVGRAFFGMPMGRAVGVAQRMGVFRELASEPAGAGELAERVDAQPDRLRMLLDLLTGDGLLTLRDGRYSLGAEARRWLDPASPRYVGTYIEHTLDYWEWWGDLERVVRGGDSFAIHDFDADDPSWAVYIRGQYELARLSAAEVARSLKLPGKPTSLLDVAGGHGWFAAALCQRHPTLRATVVDLPGSVAVGQEIMRETGMDGVVAHRTGDMFEADLGGPHDAALCFSILHHLDPEATATLLRPGGVVAILDMFRPDGSEPRRASAGVFQLFFNLTSGADVPSHEELNGQLAAAGFAAPRRVNVRSIPDLRLYRAEAVG